MSKYFNTTPGFSMAGIRKHYSVIPLLGMIGVAAVGTMAFGVYSLNKKDVVFYHNKMKPFERMDITKPQKLYYSPRAVRVTEDPAITQLKMELSKAFEGKK